jgi:hypothetical protein
MSVALAREASYVAVLFCLAVGLALVMRARRRGQFIPALWRRR